MALQQRLPTIHFTGFSKTYKFEIAKEEAKRLYKVIDLPTYAREDITAQLLQLAENSEDLGLRTIKTATKKLIMIKAMEHEMKHLANNYITSQKKCFPFSENDTTKSSNLPSTDMCAKHRKDN